MVCALRDGMAFVDARVGYIVQELGCDYRISELFEKPTDIGPAESRI